jgi:hypothetical protein
LIDEKDNPTIASIKRSCFQQQQRSSKMNSRKQFDQDV